MKLLKQNEYSMEIIEDLGMVYATPASKKPMRSALFKCQCGVIFKARTSAVKNHKTTSCGCQQKILVSKANTKHNDSFHRLYSIYNNMKARCYNPNNSNYKYYGSMGVTVCNSWLQDYSVFKAWALSNGYAPDLTLDKDMICDKLEISPKIYSPETCIWTTKKIQAKHTKDRCNSTGFRGVTFCKDRAHQKKPYLSRLNGKFIGYYSTAEEAYKRRLEYIEKDTYV